MNLTASVVERKIYRRPPFRLVQNAYGADYLELTLDEEWAGMDQVVLVWSCGGNSVSVPYAGGASPIPREALEQAGALYLSVVGYTLPSDGGEGRRIVTAKMASPWAVESSGETEGADVAQAAPGLLERLSEAARAAGAAAEQLRAQAAAGAFDGAMGPEGPQGPRGAKGAAGEKGEGVYELLAAAGYTGSREELAARLMALLAAPEPAESLEPGGGPG